MPTNAASRASAACIWSTSALSAASASGIVSGVMRLVEPRLQNDLRGDLVAPRPSGAARALQAVPRAFARPAFVDQRHGHAEALSELGRETTCASGHRVRCA